MRWFLLNTPAVILNLFELCCVCSVSLWLRFGKKKDDRSKEAAKGSKVKLEALNEEEQERIPNSRDGWGTHSLFPNKRRLCFFCFFVLKRRRWSGVIDGSRSPSWSWSNNCSLRCGEQLSLGGGTGRKKKSSASLKWFSSFQCVTQDFFFSLLTQDDFSFWFFFLAKVKFVWILFHLPPPDLACCVPGI